MTLTNGSWQVLDAPVIKEIDRITKSFYAVNYFIPQNFFIYYFLIHRNIQ
jgi:hypothetical protein